MIFNFCIFLFLICMAFAWATRGSFSALLHLLCVIVAGSLAFALWEPVAMGLLLKYFPSHGWCVSLLGVYIILLFVLGLVTNAAVPSKLTMHRVVDASIGGVLGVVSAILTSGIVVLSLGFLPLNVDLFGYQPLALDPRGQVIVAHSSGLWLSVDSLAVGFFEYFSWGPFSSSYPMSTYEPDVNRQAALYRLKNDPFSAPSMVPGSVQVHRWFQAKVWPAVLDERATQKLGDRQLNMQVVIIDTQWKTAVGTFDIDGALRVHPSQIWLLAKRTVNGVETDESIAPLAASLGDSTQSTRKFILLNDDKNVLSGNSPTMLMGWIFVLPQDVKPWAVLVRKMRFELTDKPLEESPEMAEAFGKLIVDPTQSLAVAPGSSESTSSNTVGPRVGMAANAAAVNVEVSDMLPRALSKNSAIGLYFEGNAVRSGHGEYPVAPPGAASSVLADRFWCVGHQVLVRVQITKDQAQSMLGAFRASAAALQPMQLVDSFNQTWLPVGYAIVRDSGDVKLQFDTEAPIQTVKELPVDLIGPNSQLFVYFPVKRGMKLTSLQIGTTTSQALSLELPK